MRVAGIILCGGQSRRMGKPKAWLDVDGETMLVRVVRAVHCAATPVVIVAAPGQELPEIPFPVEVARDTETGRGPLEGLAVGLRSIQGRADAVFATSCDLPLLRPDLIPFLACRLGDAAICLPRTADHDHPLAAIYRVQVLSSAESLLRNGRRRLLDLIELEETRFVSESELRALDPDLESLRNINTPDDLARVLTARSANA